MKFRKGFSIQHTERVFYRYMALLVYDELGKYASRAKKRRLIFASRGPDLPTASSELEL